MKNIQLSIIVPVYNTEKYLKRCMDSIINIKEIDYEIIIVDDGCTDDCPKICDEYASQYYNIKVIHQKNAGVSHARNVGIDLAQGKYLAFIDSDDFVNTDTYVSVINFMEQNKIEFAICDIETIFLNGQKANGHIQTLTPNQIYSHAEISSKQLMEIAGSVPTCIYKKDILDKCGIRFWENITLSEDRIFNINYLGHTDRICYIDKHMYTYNLYSNSSVRKYRENTFELYLKVMDCMNQLFRQLWSENFINDYAGVYTASFVESIRMEFHRDCPHSLKEKYRLIKKIINHDQVIECAKKADKKYVFNRMIHRKQIFLLMVTSFIRKRCMK